MGSLRLADVVRRHGQAYMDRFGASMLPSHVRALRAIAHCRTPEMGGHLGQCEQCGHKHLLYHSCRHRACPQCGYEATVAWLRQQRELLLPVRYFHVVFTLPDELRLLVRSHQRVLLGVLFRAAYESLAALCADPKYLGAAQIGALAVLHTWTRTLEWHPHVHMLVPGGGLAPDGRAWLSPPRGKRKRRKPYLVPERALADRFRGRFLDLARRALPAVTFPEIPWKKRWIVFAKPAVLGAEKILAYLGRYVHRTAMTDKALVTADDHNVTFTYRDSRDHQRKSMTLPVHELLRRFLQHVPPKGFHRVRAYGLLHPAHRATLRSLQLLLSTRSTQSPPSPALPPPPRKCPNCGQPALRIVMRLSPAECIALVAAAHAAQLQHGPRAPPAPMAGASP